MTEGFFSMTMLEFEGLAWAAGVVVRLRLVGAHPMVSMCDDNSVCMYEGGQ
jgi:hypothetical protein